MDIEDMMNLQKSMEGVNSSLPRRAPMKKQAEVRLKLAQGDHLLRFLPPVYEGVRFVPKPHVWAVTEYTHWNIPRSDNDSEAMICIAQTFSSREQRYNCAICSALDEVRNWARDRGYDRDKINELFGSHRVGIRSYVNCIDRSCRETQVVEYNGKTMEIPKIWVYPMPYRTAYAKISEAILTKDPSGEFMYGTDPFNPIEGHDVMFKITGTGIETRYTVNIARSVALNKDPEIVAAICSNAYDLSKWVSMPSDERIERSKVLADRIKGIMSDPSPARTAAKVSDSKVIVGKVDTEAAPAGAPECYGNHVLVRDVCMECDFESQCSSYSLESGRSMNERREYHGMSVSS